MGWVGTGLRRAALVAAAASALSGCKPDATPAPLHGTWYSEDERFDGRTLEIDAGRIRFMWGKQELDVVQVRAVKQEGSGDGPIRFEIEGTDREGQDTTVSLEMLLLPTQQLHLETQQAPWRRTPRVPAPKSGVAPWRVKPGAADSGGET